MTLELPIITKTRSATPPLERQTDMTGGGPVLDGFLNSPTQSAFSPSLTPNDENFRPGRHGSATTLYTQPLNPLSPSDTNSLYSARSIDSVGSQTSVSIDDGKSVFNFQPTSLAKSPVTKSVSGPTTPYWR